MAYHVANDIYNVFGKENVERWADLNSNGDDTEISDRITWAIAVSEDLLNSELRNGVYRIPFTGTIPVIITHVSAIRSGILLHDGRRVTGVEQKDSVAAFRKEYDMLVRKLVSGQLRLDVAHKSRTYPFVYDEENETVSTP